MPLHGDDRLLLAGLHRDERRDGDAGVVRLRHDHRAIDPLVAIERRLDLAQLDPVAALLDHPVAAAVEGEAAGAVLADQVAGAIPGVAAVSRWKAASVSSGWPK